MDRTLAAAFIDNGKYHRLMGVRLRPLSVWHVFLLRTVHSPFVEQGKKITLFDIREAVGICRVSFDNSRIRRPWLWPAVAALVYAWRTEKWLAYLEAHRDALNAYMGDYISKPEYSIAPPRVASGRMDPFPATKRGNAPEIFYLVADVIAFLHCGEREAWNMRIGRAYWYQMARRREAGDDVDFLEEREREFQRELKADLNQNGSH